MDWRIEIFNQPHCPDVHGDQVAEDIRQLGIDTLEAVQSIRTFLITADFDESAAHRVARELLADPVTETYHLGSAQAPPGLAKATLIDVYLKPGVTDPVASSTLMALADMNLPADNVRTARKYILFGHLSDKQIDLICRRILANDCIEETRVGGAHEPPSPHGQPYQLNIVNLPICALDDDALLNLSKDRDLFLNLAEMQTIQNYYRTLQRDPTDVELEMLAQTWSEHCVHKTFRGLIDLTTVIDGQPQQQRIDNLLKSTIARATRELDLPWCISVFEDNAGIIAFNDDYGICFKVETHNHPSAIEPYGGAATGIGGCIRDPMGTGLGAVPVANTDIFCFAPPTRKLDDLPSGVLHPRRVMKGVVAGVRDYGNRMGIPTVNGAVLFDDRYLGNPLVFCGNVGIIPRDKCFGNPQTGHLIMVVGGRTGRDGIHGATFSSGEMTHEHEDLFSHAVQIGNAITEKKVLDTLIRARDENLYAAITDCGAGGLSSAVGEMGQHLGAVVDLDKVPLKYQGLSYTEIWISEAQERMVIAVPPENLDRISDIFASENVEATVIGRFTGDKKLHLLYADQTVGEMDMDFLHDGVPKITRTAHVELQPQPEPDLPLKDDYTDDLHRLLADLNIAGKEWVIRQYDHEVQGGSAVKPLVGLHNDGPGDAAVIRPLLHDNQAVALGCGICPQYSDIDPYAMALAAVDEAIRNVVAVGADPARIALLDNFCWGNCDKPDRLGALVRAAQGCYDAALAYRTPFISGKDSLNNEFQTDSGQTISIPGTLLISAIGIVPDVHQCVTMDLKQPGNLLFLIGPTDNELGASAYYRLHDTLGSHVPRVNLDTAPRIMNALAQAIAQGLVLACHDCSEGGLAVALAEMAFAGDLGLDITLQVMPITQRVTRVDQMLFSESPTRFLVEVSPNNFSSFARLMRDIRFAEIGNVITDPRLTVRNPEHKIVLDADIRQLKESWQAPLRW